MTVDKVKLGTKIFHISSNSIHTIINILNISDTDREFTYETELGFRYKISSIVLQVQIENNYLQIIEY